MVINTIGGNNIGPNGLKVLVAALNKIEGKKLALKKLHLGIHFNKTNRPQSTYKCSW